MDSSGALVKKANKQPEEELALVRTVKTTSRRRKDGLLRFAMDRGDTYSQNGEAGIIAAIFALLPKEERWLVEVGAWDGKHLSNTYDLLVHQGWRGVLIEADETRFDELRALHEPLGNLALKHLVSCRDGHADSLPEILKRAPLEKIDLLAIDVDGADYWILADVLEKKWRPKVIVVEFNPSMPNGLFYVQPRSDEIRHGSSLAALMDLCEQQGYRLVETTLYNAFFADATVHAALRQADYVRDDDDIDSLHEVTMGTHLYQLYDGTLKIHGCRKLLWHKLAIDELKLQQIPEKMRSFPFAPNMPQSPAPCKKKEEKKEKKVRSAKPEKPVKSVRPYDFTPFLVFAAAAALFTLDAQTKRRR